MGIRCIALLSSDFLSEDSRCIGVLRKGRRKSANEEWRMTEDLRNHVSMIVTP